MRKFLIGAVFLLALCAVGLVACRGSYLVKDAPQVAPIPAPEAPDCSGGT